MNNTLTKNIISAYVCVLGNMVLVLGKAVSTVSFPAAAVIYFISGIIVMSAFLCADMRGRLTYLAVVLFTVGIWTECYLLCAVAGTVYSVAVLKSEQQYHTLYTIVGIVAGLFLTVYLNKLKR